MPFRQLLNAAPSLFLSATRTGSRDQKKTRTLKAVLLTISLSCALQAQAQNCENQAYPELSANPAVNSDSLKILGNDFPALHGLSDAVENCNPERTIQAEHSSNYRDLQLPALLTQPAAFDVVLTGNNAIVPLLNDGLLRPLDALIDKYLPELPRINRVSFGGETMAIALLANAQHLFIRKDLLESAGLSPPSTLEELLGVCEHLQQSNTLRHPFGAAFKSGWDLGLEFINHYLAAGGDFNPADNNKTGLPSVSNATGQTVLANLQALTRCMHPDYLSQGTDDIQAAWQGGKLALAQLWGSRASSILDSTDTLQVVREHTELAGAPRGDTAPIATLWWVGFAIPARLSDERAGSALRAMLKGAMSPYLLEQYNDEAVWLRSDYQPGAASRGVQDVISSNAPAYPSAATMGLVHQAAGELLPNFFNGRQTAEEILQAIDDQVRTNATEKGLTGN